MTSASGTHRSISAGQLPSRTTPFPPERPQFFAAAKTRRLLRHSPLRATLRISGRLPRTVNANSESARKRCTVIVRRKKGIAVILTALIRERLNVGMQNTQPI
ncbi:hypothetical protein Bxe_B2285 [Paraburkholderia xenovorans LB400]|jgi:hypothetical protein|uniref:Uncharacterized protein n=1 Tax=Paraburkholderia xenovorans (strain LB400) TaxID=266265 RepID=Q13QD8_PARXL|nr:hypothetical protein Bxe_B2285 [Paraburkholderia xenovorans LB400]